VRARRADALRGYARLACSIVHGRRNSLACRFTCRKAELSKHAGNRRGQVTLGSRDGPSLGDSLVCGEEELVERRSRRQLAVVFQFADVGEELFGEGAEFGVGDLRAPLEYAERRVGVDAVDQGENASNLVDEGTTVADRGDGPRDGFLLEQVGCDVEIEALGSDDFAALVLEAFTDDDDFARMTVNVDDPVSGAEGSVRSKDVLQRRCDVSDVVGMLVDRTRWVVGVTVPGS
jgi:hypothetical protein